MIQNPRIYPKEVKSLCERHTCTPVFTAALLTVYNIWYQPRYPSMDEWIKKITCAYTMEYYLPIKRMKSCCMRQLG
jgi:hypothetical protein